MAMMADVTYENGGDFVCRQARERGLSRTVLKSDFKYIDFEFTTQAIGNRQKRHQRITPILKWEFQKNTLKLMSNIRTMKPVVDSGPPKTPNVAQSRRYREEHEQIRLHAIEKENHEMLDRLRRIQNRQRSTFCHLKRRGDPLVKGDAFKLPPPSAKGNYLVEMYKKLKLANPVIARKSIRIQQEMLTSAIDLVRVSNKHAPTEVMVESEVQSTLSKEDVILPPAEPDPKQLSPVEVVQSLSPEIDAEVLDDIVVSLSPMPQPEPSLGREVPSSDTNQTKTLEASPIETSAGNLQSVTQKGPENNRTEPENLQQSRPFG